MYARMLRYTTALPENRQDLIPIDYDQYDTWSENARLARIDYLDGKLTAEEFLRKIDTMHDLEDYTVDETQTSPAETAWQRMVAGNIGFDPELHYPEGFMLLDLRADDPKWQTFSADDLRRRDQEGHRAYGKNTGRNKMSREGTSVGVPSGRILCIGDVDFVLFTSSRYFHGQNKFDLCD